MVQWRMSDDSRCPDCNGLGEDAAHLMVCPNRQRRQLLEEQIRKLEDWMESHYTDPELGRMVGQYLRGRSRRKFASLSCNSRQLLILAKTQDMIGWRNFTEGKLTRYFRVVQKRYLSHAGASLTVDSWLKAFISKLMEMTHGMWIFRCISKHHRTKGSLVLASKAKLFKEIERQLAMGEEAIAEEDRWMLEVDVAQLRDSTLEEQQYWLHAIEAARQAGTRALELTEGATDDWNDIIRDETFAHLPTTTPIPTEEEPTVEAPSSAPADTTESSNVQSTPTSLYSLLMKHTEDQSSNSTTTKPSKKQSAVPVKSPPKKARKRRMKKSSATSVQLKAYGDLRPQQGGRRFNISRDALDADNANLRLFTRSTTMSRPESRSITAAFNASPRYGVPFTNVDGGISRLEAAVVKRGEHSATQSEFRCLRGNGWLYDLVIHIFLRAYVQEKVEGAHCLSSYFFNLLWNANEEDDLGRYGGFGPRGTPPDTEAERGDMPTDQADDLYRFWRVQGMADGIEGGIFNLDNLFVPINIGNSHWLFLRVDFGTSTIELYDSLGGAPNPRNKKYMWAMREYLYDMRYRHTPVENRPVFEEWKLGWKTRDMTRSSPKQDNNDDCGVFTILSIYLISRGVQLQRRTYNQHIVTNRKLRRCIALALMKCNKISAPGAMDGFVTSQRRTATTSSRGRKRKRKETRLTAGKSKVRRDSTGPFVSPNQSDGLPVNRKRSAKSLSNKSHRQLTIDQMLQQPPKKAKGPHRGSVPS